MVAHFRVSPPSVHQMIVALSAKRLIARDPGKARSMRLVEESAASHEDPPTRPPGDITEPLDPEIAPLVEALRADGRVVTKASCCGHGKKRAYMELAVEGMDGLRLFVERLNFVDCGVRSEALFDLAVNWSEEVLTSCAFDIFPDWIMLSLVIEGSGRKGAPSAELLSKIPGRWGLAVARAQGTR